MDAAFPSGAKLGDKKQLKAMRAAVVKNEKGSYRRAAAEILADGGVGKEVAFVLPEAALVGIGDGEQKKKAYAYWTGEGSGWPAEVVRFTCEALVEICKDEEGREAVQELERVQFDLEVVGAKPSPEEAFVPHNEGDTLRIACKMHYLDGWPVSPGNGSRSKWTATITDCL